MKFNTIFAPYLHAVVLDDEIDEFTRFIEFLSDAIQLDEYFNENQNILAYYNISIEGGIWDANNRGNPRLGELFDQDCVSGTMLNFRNVGNLTLSGMVLRDP